MKDKPNCIFCNIKKQIQYEVENAFAVLDKYPVTKFHTLIIPKRHVRTYFELTDIEHMDCINLINVIKPLLCKLDRTITGFNIGTNIGKSAGQTISHCHIHLIPRRKGDVNDPTGGIRNIITEKGNYLK